MININQQLIDAGTKYRKLLLTMPVAMLQEVLAVMSLRTGIQGKEIGGVLTTDVQLRPYKTVKGESDNTVITPYEWETYLGDVVKEFDPNIMLGTLYTDTTGNKPTDREISRLVAIEMAKKVGEALYNVMFTAVRNAAGNTTADLFNGFSTLAASAVTATKLSVVKKNYADLTATPITVVNVIDILKAAYRGVDPLLKKQKINLYLPTSILELYEDAFQVEFGHVPWNADFTQRTLVGSSGKCTFVPLDKMEGTNYLFFSVRNNFLVGCDQESDKENVRIRECDNPKLVQFFMLMYFGVGFDNLDKAYIKVIKFA